MTRARSRILRLRGWAGCLLVMALLARMLVPAGFMVSTTNGAVTIELCSGYGPMTMPMPGMLHDRRQQDDGHAGHPCPFSDLAAPILTGADPLLLREAVAHILALGMQPVAMAESCRASHLRPPPRGPPALS